MLLGEKMTTFYYSKSTNDQQEEKEKRGADGVKIGRQLQPKATRTRKKPAAGGRMR
jgi:hypothetical protein